GLACQAVRCLRARSGKAAAARGYVPRPVETRSVPVLATASRGPDGRLQRKAQLPTHTAHRTTRSDKSVGVTRMKSWRLPGSKIHRCYRQSRETGTFPA